MVCEVGHALRAADAGKRLFIPDHPGEGHEGDADAAEDQEVGDEIGNDHEAQPGTQGDEAEGLLAVDEHAQADGSEEERQEQLIHLHTDSIGRKGKRSTSFCLRSNL